MAIRATAWHGVSTDGPWLLTRNLVPGVSVYGEGRPRDAGIEYRRWDANRSKLAAYLKCGGRVWPFRDSTSVLYLGAGSGTTVSHLSDVCRGSAITAIEISPRSFRDLLGLAETRSNVMPILADAATPETYAGRVGRVDVLYQDVAQRDQDRIFLKNADFLRPGGVGFLAVKARSEDSTAEPVVIYDQAKRALSDAGLAILDVRVLSPFQDDHAFVVVQKP